MFPNLKVDVESELKRYKSFASKVRPLVADTVSLLDKEIRLGKRILVEGANAAMLDIDFGISNKMTDKNLFLTDFSWI